jgi:hypothetical protein
MLPNQTNDLHSRSLHARQALASRSYSSRNTENEISRAVLCTFKIRSLLTPRAIWIWYTISHSVQITINTYTTYSEWAEIAQSVKRLSKGWDVLGSNPGRCEILRTRPDRPWGSASLLHNAYRISFTGVKRPGRGADHPPHPAPRLKEEQSYSSTPPKGHHGLF